MKNSKKLLVAPALVAGLVRTERIVYGSATSVQTD